MSARLGFNEIKYQTWKGQTFTQISSKIQKNSISRGKGSPNIFRANPLPIYRREIANIYNAQCSGNARTSLGVRQFEQPGGVLTYQTTAGNKHGVESIADAHLIKTINQTNETFCNKGTTPTKCLSAQRNALRRTRSSGIIKRNYYSDTTGYLYSRKRSIEQNQFNYISSGTSTVKPGSPLSIQNKYYSAGDCVNTSSCPVVYKPNNYNYSQQGAVDSSTRLDRLKYNTINTSAYNSKGVYGAAMADSLAYGVPEIGYNVKNMFGFSVTNVPVISKYTGAMKKCIYVRVQR